MDREKIARIALDQANAARTNRSIVTAGGSETYNSAVERELSGGAIVVLNKKPDLSKVKARAITAKQRDKEEVEVERLIKELKNADERLAELRKDPKKNKREIEILREKMADPRIKRYYEKKNMGFTSIIPVEEEIKKLLSIEELVDEIMDLDDEKAAHNTMIITKLVKKRKLGNVQASNALRFIREHPDYNFYPGDFGIPEDKHELFRMYG